VPLYQDDNTDMNTVTAEEPFAGKIYMDAMGFGMGMACLQCTFNTKNVNQATYLHDMLHVLSPIFLSLTAGTPILKGKLSNWDARWKIIEDSVDDRTSEEMNVNSIKYQQKSRYSSMSHYIWNSPLNRPEYNDEKTSLNAEVVDLLRK
jgi:glutamate--cysteine ligase catalytic subunit